MLLEQLDFTLKYDYTLVLTKKNKSPICILSEAYSRSLNVKMEDINSLTFTIPYYIEDKITHEQIKNPNYDYVIEENMVLLKAGDASNPYFEAYFIIKGIDEETDKLSKSVRCSSREIMLNKDTITLDGSEFQLKKDDVNIADGVFDVLSNETTWSAGHIDPSAKVEPPNIGNVNKYRWFDTLSKPWLQFLREDVQSAFNVVLFYDTKNKLIDVYNRDNFGTHTGIILTEENYIKNLKKKTNSENIVTKLNVTGRDEATFESINPLGGDFVLNYDYFKANGQMSTELVNALNRYDILINEKNIDFQNILSQINDLNVQLTTKQTELSSLNEELKALRILQSQYMADGDNTNLPTATTNVNNKVAEIGQKQNEINNINNQIDTLNTQKTDISNAIDKNNATDSQGKIFDNDLLDELADFTYAESWTNNYYDSTQLPQLYNAGIEKLKDWSIPPIEFEVDSVDLFGAIETQHWWDKIKLGDFVRFYSERLNINTDVRIVEYTYNIDSNDLNFTFSNKDKKLDDTRSITNTTRKANDSSKILNVKKLEWNNIKDTKNAVENFLNNALDTSRQTIISQVGRNKISIDENGIFVYDADNMNHSLAILSGLIAFTEDGWQTANTAIDNTGVYAKYLVGQIILGNNLYIANEANNVSIDKNGIIIKNDSGVTIITPNQINASAITTGTLDAELVNVINLVADNINTGTLDAQKVTVINLSAGSITTGTLDASKVSVSNLSADNITTGTLKVGAKWITGNGNIYANGNGLYNDFGGVSNSYKSMVYANQGAIANPSGSSGLTISLPSKFKGKTFDVNITLTGFDALSGDTNIYVGLDANPDYANGTFRVTTNGTSSNVNNILFTYIAIV